MYLLILRVHEQEELTIQSTFFHKIILNLVQKCVLPSKYKYEYQYFMFSYTH